MNSGIRKRVRLALIGGTLSAAALLFVTSPEPVQSQTSAAAPASVWKLVNVPASMRSAPFNVPRHLLVPPDFSISVYARVSGARFMAVAPNGDLLVSQPGPGRILLIRSMGGGDPAIHVFVSGLNLPHDMVFRTFGSTTYLYVAESHQISRYVYRFGDTTAQARQVVVTGLPNPNTPDVGGSYSHPLKNIAIGPDGKLYVSVASATNVSPTDALANPVRSAIYQYNADGTGGRLFARGLRNAEGLAFLPGTNTLWVTVNHRDNIRVPHHRDWDGDSRDDYGRLMYQYVDDHPPDGFTSVRDGGNYGWPWANPNPDTATGLDHMPHEFDYENNREWSRFPQAMFTRFDKGFWAHAAPLGFSFLQASNVPQPYRSGAVVALHGSWNRSSKRGYKVIFFPFGATLPGEQIDLVRGWLNPATQSYWGRPVDVVPDLDGDLYISDNHGSAIYRLRYEPRLPPAVSSFSLMNTDTDQPFPAYKIVLTGTVIDLSSLPTRNLSLRANTTPASVGSVEMRLTGPRSFTRVDNLPPYVISGESGANILPLSPQLIPGAYVLTGRAYTQPNAQGIGGPTMTARFSIVP